MFCVKDSLKGKSLTCNRNFCKGEIVLEFIGSFKSLNEADKKALQIDDNLMIESTQIFDNYINHSCTPNIRILIKNHFGVVRCYAEAISDIQAGEEIYFNYNTTEYDLMEQGVSFVCQCGSKNCCRVIKGYRYLSIIKKNEIAHLLIPYLAAKYDLEIGQSKNVSNSNILSYNY